jgi:acetyl esterase
VVDLAADRRLDPRVKWALRNVPVTELGDVDSRERLLEISNSPKAIALRDKTEALYDTLDTEEVAPSDGLAISVHEFVSAPDANTVKIRFVRPEGDDVVPCVYYLHGGGMQNGTAFGAMYRVWARVLAARGSPWRWSTSATV